MSITSEYKGVSGLYCLECKANGKKYIGQSKNLYRRAREHLSDLRTGKHHNSTIQKDYDTYGRDMFDIYVVTTDSSVNLDELEEIAIQKLGGIESGLCYNVFSGGRTTFVANQEFKDNATLRFRGRAVSEETRKKNADILKSRWNDNNYRNTMTESARNQWNNPEYREKMRQIHTGNCNACSHKLTPSQVKEARIRYANGERTEDLAKEYGVAKPTMTSAINKTTWKHIE